MWSTSILERIDLVERMRWWIRNAEEEKEYEEGASGRASDTCTKSPPDACHESLNAPLEASSNSKVDI